MISGFLSGFIVVVVISVIGWLITLFKKAKSLPQNFAARKVANSEAEEGLYDFIRQEIESGEIRSGLWTKAEATANSTENAAIRAKYIQLRFEQIEAQGQLQEHELNEVEESTPEVIIQISETTENTVARNSDQAVENKTKMKQEAFKENNSSNDDVIFTIALVVILLIVIMVFAS